MARPKCVRHTCVGMADRENKETTIIVHRDRCSFLQFIMHLRTHDICILLSFRCAPVNQRQRHGWTDLLGHLVPDGRAAGLHRLLDLRNNGLSSNCCTCSSWSWQDHLLNSSSSRRLDDDRAAVRRRLILVEMSFLHPSRSRRGYRRSRWSYRRLARAHPHDDQPARVLLPGGAASQAVLCCWQWQLRHKEREACIIYDVCCVLARFLVRV